MSEKHLCNEYGRDEMSREQHKWNQITITTLATGRLKEEKKESFPIVASAEEKICLLQSWCVCKPVVKVVSLYM